MSVRFEKVSVEHSGGVRAVDQVSVEIPAGQFCVFLGSSGAGKTTLLKTVNALLQPTEGRVFLNEVAVERRSLRRIRRRISMIHQQFHLVSRLSVERNVLSGAVADLSMGRIWSSWYPAALRSKAARLCRQVGLQPSQFQRRAADLSGGQQQRVGIARAFILDPEVVLADEPVASLDPETSREILTILREAARDRGTTVLCSLHQVDLAREFADRVVGMRAGRVHFDVPVEALSESHLRSLYTQKTDSVGSGEVGHE